MAVSDRYDVVGGVICGVFVTAGVTSVVLDRPWRRWVNGCVGPGDVRSTDNAETSVPVGVVAANEEACLGALPPDAASRPDQVMSVELLELDKGEPDASVLRLNGDKGSGNSSHV